MNKIKKSEREALENEAYQLVGGYWQNINDIVWVLVSRHQIGEQRARGYAAKAVRRWRYDNQNQVEK